MSFRSRVAIGGALLAVAAVPASAHGATKRPDLRATGLVVNSASIQAGQSFTAFGRVANRKGHRATSGRITFSLRTSRRARSGRALGRISVKRLRGGRGRLFKIPMVIRIAQPAGRYYLFACVGQKGRKRAKCVSRRLTIRRAPAAPQPPAPQPPAPPAPDTRSP